MRVAVGILLVVVGAIWVALCVAGMVAVFLWTLRGRGRS